MADGSVQRNLYGHLAAGFAARPDAVALEVPGGPRMTYRELDREAGRWAAALRGLGLTPGARVAVQVEKSPEAVLLHLALLRAGLVHLPLNPAYRPAELEHFLTDARPQALVCDPAREDTLAPLARAAGVRHLLTLDAAGGGSLPERAVAAPRPLPTEPRAADDPAAILYTSGTTGPPKGAVITHGNLVANARALERAWGWREDDVLVHTLPLFHVHGLFVACHLALRGSRLRLLPRFEPEAVVHAFAGATVFMGVPTQYARLLTCERLTREACAGMRLFVSGSAPLPARIFEAFRERTGHAILERYGMTEIGMALSNPLAGPRVPGTVGVPLPGVEVRIVDARGLPAADGETGELQVRGPSVFAGYWNAPERTAAAFAADGWFRTGDLARRDPASGHYAIVGRLRALIVTGGYKVQPEEVERHLEALPGVAESAVFGVPHPEWGEAVTAAVVPEPAARLEEAALRAALRERLAPYKVPKRILVVEALPRNAMGKVERRCLAERHRGLYAGAAPLSRRSTPS